MTFDLVLALRLAGLAQLSIAVGSLAVPRALGWNEELARLTPLTRRVFWTYAGYILFTNILGGIFALAAAPALARPSTLGVAVCLYFTLYWGARLVLQFAAFGPVAPPRTPITRLAEIGLTSAFAYIAFTFGAALVRQLGPAV